MKVRYIMEYNDCYLKNLSNISGLKILKKELNGNIMNEIIEINYNNNFDDIIKNLKNSKKVLDINVLYTDEKIVIIMLKIVMCNLIPLIKKYSNNHDFESDETINGNLHIWGISLKNINDIKILGELLKNKAKILSTKIDRSNIIKLEYFSILNEAFDLGYFDVPKRINLIELSKALNIKPTRLNMVIRKSLNHFLDKSFKND